MSWDLLIQHLPEGAKSNDDIPEDYDPPPIAPREEIIRKIREIVPDVDFSDPSVGIIDRDDWLVEVRLGKNEVCNCIFLSSGGDEEVVEVVSLICEKLGLPALDPQTGELFQPGGDAVESYRGWFAFCQKLIG